MTEIARKHHAKSAGSLSLLLSSSHWELVLPQHYAHLLSSHWGHAEKLYLFLPHGDDTYRSQNKGLGEGTDIYSGPVTAITVFP